MDWRDDQQTKTFLPTWPKIPLKKGISISPGQNRSKPKKNYKSEEETHDLMVDEKEAAQKLIDSCLKKTESERNKTP